MDSSERGFPTHPDPSSELDPWKGELGHPDPTRRRAAVRRPFAGKGGLPAQARQPLAVTLSGALKSWGRKDWE